MKPLVSILIPAHNAEEWIAETLESALGQTWQRKEVVVVDDGSTDQTAEVARRYASSGVRVLSTENQGQSAAQNHAFRQCQGDYIQYLDADDLLAADKIERQLEALREGDSKRILLSSPWAPLFYRTRHARFVQNSLCQDLTPVEWLLKKLGENVHMGNSTWLVSRELAEAAGGWDTRLHYDQDGEYFARVLLASEGTRFVPGTGSYYRFTGGGSVRTIGKSDRKKDSLLLSMKLHIQYLRLLEESDRVRKACLTYLQNWYFYFYPERPDLVAELQSLAAQLRGRLEVPRLRSKYAWMAPVFGWKVAKRAQMAVPNWKVLLQWQWDKAMYKLEGGEAAVRQAPGVSSTYPEIGA
jgi:glycosyltransferase involved in cell wall biosynthesis